MSAFVVDELRVSVVERPGFGAAVAAAAAGAIAASIAARGEANVIFATGNSQLPLYAALGDAAAAVGVDWTRVRAFHMDEYVGLDATHPASFAKYIRERVGDEFHPGELHLIDGTADPERECARYTALLAAHPADLCCLGIGENGHLAFNDPPVADAHDPLTVKVVELDAACRAQQVGEGHFPTVDAVPAHAVTVTIPALLAARTVLAVVPEARKAAIVRRSLTDPIGPACPATFLRRCGHAQLFLDDASAAEVVSA